MVIGFKEWNEIQKRSGNYNKFIKKGGHLAFTNLSVSVCSVKLQHWSPTLDVKEKDLVFEDAPQIQTLISNHRAKDVASAAISKVAHKGYIHNDVAWRHVALLPVFKKSDDSSSRQCDILSSLEPVLIDLVSVKEAGASDDYNARVDSMESQLLESLPSMTSA